MRPATAWKYSWPLNNIVTKLLFLDFPPHDYARFHRRAWQRLLVWSHSTGTLENAPSTFRCWPLGITIIFSNNILWAFSICSSFSVSREASSTGVSSHVVCHNLTRNFTHLTFELHVLQTYSWRSNEVWMPKYCWSGYSRNFHWFLMQHFVAYMTYMIKTFSDFLFECLVDIILLMT